MSDRLEELLEQKRLIESHLRWLESEIGAERTRRHPAPEDTESPDPAAPAPTQTAVAAASQGTAPEAVSPDPLAEAGIDPQRFEIDHGALKSEVRRGCLIYLAIFGGLALATGLILYLMYR